MSRQLSEGSPAWTTWHTGVDSRWVPRRTRARERERVLMGESQWRHGESMWRSFILFSWISQQLPSILVCYDLIPIVLGPGVVRGILEFLWCLKRASKIGHRWWSVSGTLKISHKAWSTQAKSSGVLWERRKRLWAYIYRAMILCSFFQCICKAKTPFNHYPFLGFWPQVIDGDIAWSDYKDRILLKTQVFRSQDQFSSPSSILPQIWVSIPLFLHNKRTRQPSG